MKRGCPAHYLSLTLRRWTAIIRSSCVKNQADVGESGNIALREECISPDALSSNVLVVTEPTRMREMRRQ